MFTWTGSTWAWPCWRLLWWTPWLTSSPQSQITPTRARNKFIHHNNKCETICLVCLEDILETYWSGLQWMLELWENVWIHKVFLSNDLGEEKNSYYSSADRSTEGKKNISNAKIHLNKKEMIHKLPLDNFTWKNWYAVFFFSITKVSMVTKLPMILTMARMNKMKRNTDSRTQQTGEKKEHPKKSVNTKQEDKIANLNIPEYHWRREGSYMVYTARTCLEMSAQCLEYDTYFQHEWGRV